MSDKRTELEELATELVQRSGLREVSFRTLAERTGIKSSSVHYYFPGKGDLTSALIENYTTTFLQHLSDISAAGQAPREQLMAFINLFDINGKANKMCLCGMLAAEVASLDEASLALLQAFFTQCETWLTALFSSPGVQLTQALPPSRLAAMVMSGLEGALLLDRVHPQSSYLESQRLLLGGLFKPSV